MQPTLLMYNMNAERARQMRMAAMLVKLRVVAVQPEQFGVPVGALCGATPMPEALPEAQPFDEEMLVLAGLASATLNSFLQSFRRLRIAPVALKAVLTPTNATWSGTALHDELSREREAFARGESAHA